MPVGAERAGRGCLNILGSRASGLGSRISLGKLGWVGE